MFSTFLFTRKLLILKFIDVSVNCLQSPAKDYFFIDVSKALKLSKKTLNPSVFFLLFQNHYIYTVRSHQETNKKTTF